MDYEFNSADGTTLKKESNDGSDTSSWNFGIYRVQAGALNVGYTQEFKSPEVDNNEAEDGKTSLEFRKYTLNSAITSGDFEFVVDFA